MGEVRAVPMIPLRDMVIFPHVYVPLLVGREKSVLALDNALQSEDKYIFLTTQKNPKVENPTTQDIYSVGTLSLILQSSRLPDKNIKVVVEGKVRAKINRFLDTQKIFFVEVEEVEEVVSFDPETKSLIKSIIIAFEKYARLNPKVPPEFLSAVSKIKDPSTLADVVASQLSLRVDVKQTLLEEFDAKKRLEKVYQLLEGELQAIETEKKVREKVRRQGGEARGIGMQGEVFQDEWNEEISELERKAEEKDLPEKVREVVNKEIRKLKFMSPLAAEAVVVRGYVDWLLSVPWNERTEDKLDLKEARKILDEDHWGLEKVKDRILEYLAVRKLAGSAKSTILFFVGPPGVGKTSLGKSIARATGRNFVRLSLGGVRDEAEIRGHRRTYIGALPGRIIQMMKKAGTKNPVFLLDEVDKLCADFRGDPAAALLEVLDPEQNHSFLDHYLDIEYDLSEVFFICTANVTHTVPPALQDRMEAIHLPGYTEHEKYNIAKHFLIKKQQENTGLKSGIVNFSRDSIYRIIREYTREAGVRNLEREIGNILRKIVKKIVEEGKDMSSGGLSFNVNTKDVPKYLGVPKFKNHQAESREMIGVVRGLAWTETGGEVLMIEVGQVPGSGKLTITGKLGEVMQESAKAAVSYIRMRAKDIGIDPEFYSKIDIHIHVPEGAVPKDGPSAGITIATALASAFTKIPARSDFAMTGEITLRGRVLGIGGVKEKLLAAHRDGIKNVILPSENEKDIPDVPKDILKDLNVIYVDHMDKVLELSLAVQSPDEIWKGRGQEQQQQKEQTIAQ